MVLENCREALMRRYDSQNTMARRSAAKLVKSVPIYFDDMAMCISKAILKSC